ncbi:dihydroxyacetone kinase subunit DhaL [Georgenia sp. Z1344]|uniref:dihydroxyacetone kinase subunit DhaL n=1 Tax=Georgenia sp. Z1344 TaxID=3416706 RepID=UPI003CEAA1D1
MADQLTAAQTATALTAACDAIVAAKERLTRADQAIGDGDHGVGMARGFTAAKEALAEASPATPGEAFKAVGSAVLATSGGASGAIFGTMFRAPAKVLTGDTLDADGFATALEAGAEQVMRRGKAEVGQKTMLDALVPAAEAARAAVGQGLAATARAAAVASADGVERSAELVSGFGKSRSLGERSVGHPDPGAISVSVLLGAIADVVDTL